MIRNEYLTLVLVWSFINDTYTKEENKQKHTQKAIQAHTQSGGEKLDTFST